MTTLEGAWQAYRAAVAEAQELHGSGAGAEVLQGALRRARELLAILDDELAAHRLDMPHEIRDGLEQLRAELAELDVGPVTRH